MTHLRIFSILSFAFIIVNAQAQAPKIKTQKTPSGFQYKIIKSNKGARISAGDLVYLKLRAIVSDSVLYDTYRNHQAPYMNLVLAENTKKGNFEEGLTLLTTGDSAFFILSVDSFFGSYINSPPPLFVKREDPVYFYIKVDSFVTKKVLDERKIALELEMAEKQKNEQKTIDEYIKSTGLLFTKTASGMYYIITKKTTGPKANNGDKVSAIYTGKLLNGKVFDSNKISGQPFEFSLGLHMVIAGWDEIFSILNEGENATIVLPSALGYGAQGAGADIGPYAPLIFDVEFVKVIKQ